MWKKFLLLSFSLLLLLAANLNFVWKVSVNDTSLPGFYSSKDIKNCQKLSAEAAEEISAGRASPAIIRKQLRLSFSPPRADKRLLNNCLLLYSGGVQLADGVFVNGRLLGTVDDGNKLSQMLRSYIKNQMPNSAVFGSISGKLQIRPVFSRENHLSDYEDMILLVSGMAPVFYVDSSGHIV